MTVTRPFLRYHGGKWRMAPWIISHFPPHQVYVEPFGGGASVLLRKPRSRVEVYNDLDEEIVNVFRVLRDPGQAERLVQLMELTPYARVEFDLAYEHADDPVERARRTLFRSAAGYSSIAATGKWRTGFSTKARGAWTTRADDWRNMPGIIPAAVERLQGVIIEHDDALAVIKRYDGEDALFYVDPPYPQSTRYVRWAGEAYRHEMTDQQHEELLQLLKEIRGSVVISTYDNDLYRSMLGDWHWFNRKTYADGARKRTEFLILKQQPGQQLSLIESIQTQR